MAYINVDPIQLEKFRLGIKIRVTYKSERVTGHIVLVNSIKMLCTKKYFIILPAFIQYIDPDFRFEHKRRIRKFTPKEIKKNWLIEDFL